MSFSIEKESLATDTIIIRPHGDLDVLTAPQLKETLVSLITQGTTKIIIDLHGVSFIDSTTLGVLIGTLRRLKAVEGELVLVCDDKAILTLIELTGLDAVFTIVPTEAEAIQLLVS